MNIIFSGLHGTGKSTIAKMIAEQFSFTFYSTGMVFRDLAQAKGMSLEEFSKYSETNPEVDKELDNTIIKMAESGKNYVFDGQLPAFLLREKANLKILLKCEDQIRIQRMADRDGRTFEAQKHETIMREKSEQERFIKLYNIDVLDPGAILDTYDLIINTTKLGKNEVFALCKTAVEIINIKI
jgi:CMP/dCMP kinase